MKPQILSGSAVFVFPGCCLRPHGCSGRRVCFVRPGCLLGLAAVCAGGRRPAREPSRRVLLLVAPRAFRAPEDPAAREARASLRSSRASKPARALRSLRRPPYLWGWVAVVWFGASSRSPARSLRRPRAPQPRPVVPHVVASSVVVGVLRHAKPSGGVSPACRRLGWRHSPRFEAVRWQLGVVRRSKRRPLR